MICEGREGEGRGGARDTKQVQGCSALGRGEELPSARAGARPWMSAHRSGLSAHLGAAASEALPNFMRETYLGL